MAFEVHSQSMHSGQNVPESFVYSGMGCTGKNLSPEIGWKDPPHGTKSFAITCFDPDAPHEGGWWHWGVVNIPVDVNHLEEGASGKNIPQGAEELVTDFKKTGYGGPCPPQGHGPHRYIFSVYALNTDHIAVDKHTHVKDILNELDQWSLAEAHFTVKYAH